MTKFQFSNRNMHIRRSMILAWANSITMNKQDQFYILKELEFLVTLYGSSLFLNLIEQKVMTSELLKLKTIINRISYGTDVINLVGMTGSGKTAFMFFMAEQVYKTNGRHSYFVGFPYVSGLPGYIHFVDKDSILNLKNCIVWVDEVSLIFNTKDWNSKDNQKILKPLMGLKRQKKVSYVFGSQLGSDMSIEMFRRGDITIIKKFSFLMLDTDSREKLFRPFKFFFPDNNVEMLYISQDYKTYVSTSLASFWNDKISNAFG